MDKYIRVWIGKGKRVHLIPIGGHISLCGNCWGDFKHSPPESLPLCKVCERVAQKEEVVDGH